MPSCLLAFLYNYYYYYNIKQTVSMLQADKKKRTHSGSRSKSRKNHGYDYSLQLKNKAEHSKVKTENSSSLNRSRPSRKNSTKQKKHSKSNNKDCKDPASHSVSADRRQSIIRVNRTEANFESEDVQVAVDQLISGLRSIPQPSCLNATVLSQYFNSMRKYYCGLDGPFYRLCLELHALYVSPMQSFLELVAPMEDVIRRKEQIASEIDKQIIQNEELYAKLNPIDVEIFKLKEKIEENRVRIDEKREEKQLKSKEREREREREKEKEKDIYVHTEEQLPEAEPEKQPEVKGMGIGKGFKLDLNNIHKLGHLGYHEEFYSKMDQFSESWRDQALREKRF